MDNEFDPETFFQTLREYKFPSLRPQRSRAVVADTEWYVEKAIRLYQIPDSDAEALMIAAPYEEPSVSWESVYREEGDLIDAVEEVFGALSE